MAERLFVGQLPDVWGKRVFCSVCHQCRYFIKMNSNWPYHCTGSSLSTAARRVHDREYDENDCPAFREKKEETRQDKDTTPKSTRHEERDRSSYRNKTDDPEERINARFRSEEETYSRRRYSEETYEAPDVQPKKTLDEVINETNTYGEKNNLVRVEVCLPEFKNDIYINNYFLSFLKSHEKIGRFINASDFGKEFLINIPKEGIEKILESDKMKDYFSNRMKNDMFLFRNKDNYIILSPKIISKTKHKSNDEMSIVVNKTPYRIWLKETDVLPFVKEYNKRIKIFTIIKNITTIFICAVIGGIGFLILFLIF